MANDQWKKLPVGFIYMDITYGQIKWFYGSFTFGVFWTFWLFEPCVISNIALIVLVSGTLATGIVIILCCIAACNYYL